MPRSQEQSSKAKPNEVGDERGEREKEATRQYDDRGRPANSQDCVEQYAAVCVGNEGKGNQMLTRQTRRSGRM